MVETWLAAGRLVAIRAGEPSLEISAKDHVDAFARGLAVIEAFDASDPEMTLTEVARKTGLTPAAARRSLLTLKALGYVRSVGRRYVLAPKILGLGSSYLQATHVDESLMPELIRIVSTFGDAASIATLIDEKVLYLAHFSGQHGVRATAGVGRTYPAYPTSLGRVLLAGRSDAEVDEYLRTTEFSKLTDRTEVDPEILRAKIREARSRGYATVRDELAYGVTALAVPILLNQRVVAAINSSGYSGSITPEKLICDRLTDLRLAAGRISDMLLRYPALRHSLAMIDSRPGGGVGAP